MNLFIFNCFCSFDRSDSSWSWSKDRSQSFCLQLLQIWPLTRAEFCGGLGVVILLAKIRCRLVGFRPVRKLIRLSHAGFVWETKRERSSIAREIFFNAGREHLCDVNEDFTGDVHKVGLFIGWFYVIDYYSESKDRQQKQEWTILRRKPWWISFTRDCCR